MKPKNLNLLKILEDKYLTSSCLFEELGEISDYFSPYLNKQIFENEILIRIWNILINIYINNPRKENQLEALFVIYDMYIYC